MRISITSLAEDGKLLTLYHKVYIHVHVQLISVFPQWLEFWQNFCHTFFRCGSQYYLICTTCGKIGYELDTPVAKWLLVWGTPEYSVVFLPL